MSTATVVWIVEIPVAYGGSPRPRKIEVPLPRGVTRNPAVDFSDPLPAHKRLFAPYKPVESPFQILANDPTTILEIGSTLCKRIALTDAPGEEIPLSHFIRDQINWLLAYTDITSARLGEDPWSPLSHITTNQYTLQTDNNNGSTYRKLTDYGWRKTGWLLGTLEAPHEYNR